MIGSSDTTTADGFTQLMRRYYLGEMDMQIGYRRDPGLTAKNRSRTETNSMVHLARIQSSYLYLSLELELVVLSPIT